jgi:two-component system LytT family response regulator
MQPTLSLAWALALGAAGTSLVALTVAAQRGHYLVRASLASLETRLAPDVFVRTHRTAIVNLKHVRESHDREGLRLVMSEGTQVGVSRSRRSLVESLLSPRLR